MLEEDFATGLKRRKGTRSRKSSRRSSAKKKDSGSFDRGIIYLGVAPTESRENGLRCLESIESRWNLPSTLLYFCQHRLPVKLSHCLIIMPSSSVDAGEDGHPSSALDSSKYLEPLTETINSRGGMCFTSSWGTKFFSTSYDGFPWEGMPVFSEHLTKASGSAFVPATQLITMSLFDSKMESAYHQSQQMAGLLCQCTVHLLACLPTKCYINSTSSMSGPWSLGLSVGAIPLLPMAINTSILAL